MSPSTTPLLQINEVTKAFGGIYALNEVSFDLHAGEILGIIGPNGSGKTTLLKLIGGQLRPDAGHSRCHNRRFVKRKIAYRRLDMIPVANSCRQGLIQDFNPLDAW